MLWGRYYAQEETAGRAEGRQEAHEAGRQRGNSAGSFFGHFKSRGQVMNFALFMLAALVLTGAIWLLDNLWLRKSRVPGAKEPMLVEYSKSFFPVILAVFLIRSFLVEPFKIPSGSMMPTLLVGDFILVNKYTYGLRVPVANNTFFEMKHPQRGEVMVLNIATSKFSSMASQWNRRKTVIMTTWRRGLTRSAPGFSANNSASTTMQSWSMTGIRQSMAKLRCRKASISSWATIAITATIAVSGGLCRIATLSVAPS